MEKVELRADLANLSEEQFFMLCIRNKGLRIERDKNLNIIIMPPTGSETGNTNLEIGSEVRNWNKETKLGYTFDSNTGFTMPNKAMRSPDVSWIAKEKWEKIPRDDRKRFAHICPDFIIELVSESDSIKDTMEKMEEWIANGCLLGWLIDPESRITYIYKPNHAPSKIPFSKTLSGETILPGFELKLDEII